MLVSWKSMLKLHGLSADLGSVLGAYLGFYMTRKFFPLPFFRRILDPRFENRHPECKKFRVQDSGLTSLIRNTVVHPVTYSLPSLHLTCHIPYLFLSFTYRYQSCIWKIILFRIWRILWIVWRRSPQIWACELFATPAFARHAVRLIFHHSLRVY